MDPELSRPFAIERVGEGARVDVEASSPERDAVARRMGLQDLLLLVCRFELRRAGGGAVQAHGCLRARVIQTCVVTLEPFESDITEDFDVRFVPDGQESETLDLDADDEVPFTGGAIDLGEATSEQLALALDPFPRKPGAELPPGGDEIVEGPFAGLRRLS